MVTRRCKSCGGTYTGSVLDGGSYFHVCPDARILEAGQGPVPIAHRRDERLRKIAKDGTRVLMAEGLGSEKLPDPAPTP